VQVPAPFEYERATSHDAERLIADPVVRNRGTIGGALCQADPSEDLRRRGHALRRAPRRGAGGRAPIGV